MFEKVNPSHPDKLADRIAGAIVDLAYSKVKNPRVAVEVLLGHGKCTVMIESNVTFNIGAITQITNRIAGITDTYVHQEPQDEKLAANQKSILRCGDNGVFAGYPITEEEAELTMFVKELYRLLPHDGKFILTNDELIVCQSNVGTDLLADYIRIKYCKLLENRRLIVNPLGDWTGGTDVDCGATNRKLGSDMGRSITGGGLHGKDLSKADVSLNIYAFMKAQDTGKPVQLSCAIGDTRIDGKSYDEIVDIARRHIKAIGGFEKFAEWGLI